MSELPAESGTGPSLSKSDWDTCLHVLQTVSENIALVDLDEQFKALVAKINKKGRKHARHSAEEKRRQLDRKKRATTGMVQTQIAQASTTPFLVPPLAYLGARYDIGFPNPLPQDDFPETFASPVRCYICKAFYKPLHFFYHLLCPNCARLNYAKRTQTVDLKGRIALVTGGRVKVGYQTVLRLLRDGAKVITTTRFPRDAARRYEQEPDFVEWRDRLTVFGIDLRRPTDVEAFADFLNKTLPHLDILINNAAQTIKRPLAWYTNLLQGETEMGVALSPEAEELLPPSSLFPSSPLLETYPQYPLTPDMIDLEHYFPNGVFDGDGQALDTRLTNSWKLKLGEIPAVETVEVMLVNAIAPFILSGQLKPLLLASPFPHQFIINVSAMEGQFTRASKTADHPHTNMAKAALNMLTRTASIGYAEQKIYMTAVDTGWITDEKPLEQRERYRDERDFYPPLDIIDGASRIYDPIVQGIVSPDNPILYGVFVKDYRVHPW